MITKELKGDTVLAAIAAAGRAPSVHNTQPWRFRLSDRQVELYADYSRWLPATDADARDLLVSCGAALHHLRVALEALGVGAAVHRLPDPQHPDLLARIDLEDQPPRAGSAQLFEFITARRTDRRPFRNWPIPAAFVRNLVDRAAEQGALLRPIQDAHAQEVLLRTIQDAAATQERDLDYADELGRWTGRSGEDGIPRANLPQSRPETVAAARTFGGGDLESTPGGSDPETSTLMVLGTTSADRLAQLRAGEALSAVLLQATEHGLATCPLSQPLEVSEARQLLEEEVLGGTMSPQLVLRVGWAAAGSPPPATPRRPVAEFTERR